MPFAAVPATQLTRPSTLAILARQGLGDPMAGNANAGITVHWPQLSNEDGYGLLWFASWIVDDEGVEGDWFYSGRGGETQTTPVPDEAIGVRVRRWPSEGIEAEYADVLLNDGARELWASSSTSTSSSPSPASPPTPRAPSAASTPRSVARSARPRSPRPIGVATPGAGYES